MVDHNNFWNLVNYKNIDDFTTVRVFQMKEKLSCRKNRIENPDVKEMMATLLIQHNLLRGKAWEKFHQDILKIVEKYHPIYKKNLKKYFEEGMGFSI
jgi:hypothetical protein